MTFSPFFFFFVSHLSFSGFFSLSLTLSLTAHQIRLAIRNIPTLNPFATIPFAKPIHDDPICDDPHSRRSRRIVHRRRQIVRRTRRFCLLIITFARRRRICSPLSHLLAVVAFACSSSLKLARRRWSLIVVADQTLATFRLPPTLTLQLPFADSTPTALQLPPTPTVRLPFTDSNPRDPSASTSTDDPSPSLQTFFFS